MHDGLAATDPSSTRHARVRTGFVSRPNRGQARGGWSAQDKKKLHVTTGRQVLSWDCAARISYHRSRSRTHGRTDCSRKIVGPLPSSAVQPFTAALIHVLAASGTTEFDSK